MFLQRKKTEPKKPSYEDLGKMIQNIYESGYTDRNQAYKMSFIKGILSGVGGVIGATLVVALLLWLLSFLDSLPFVGEIFNNIQTTIDSK